MRTIHRLGAVVLLTLGTTGICRAGDFCITDSAIGVTRVGKTFRVPPSGRCREWDGFMIAFIPPARNLSSGSACTSSDGTHVSFSITTSFDGTGGPFAGRVVVDRVVLALPGLTGTLEEYQPDVGSGGTTLGPIAATANPCPAVETVP